jgi:hypothetical protein
VRPTPWWFLLVAVALLPRVACAQAADAPSTKPVELTVRPHVISWGHSISFDEHGLPTPDAWFDVEFAVHADREIILGCPRIQITTAVTDSGEKLIQIPALLDWSLNGDDAQSSSTCHVVFQQPQKPAKSLTIQGAVTVAPVAALRYVDLFPLGKYLGSWVAVQGLPGGSVHVYRQDNALWLQFSPALSEVFHGMHYAEADGTELDIPEWTTSDDALPAYTNQVQLGDGGRVSVGYFDLGKVSLVPFSCNNLPLDGRPVERTPAPEHCPSTAPSRAATQAAPEAGQGHASEKF